MPMITITEGHSLSTWKPNKHEEEKMRSLIVDFINRLKMNKSPSEHNMICLAKPKRGAGLAKNTYAQKDGKHWRIDLEKYTAGCYYADFNIQVGSLSVACLLLQTDQWFKSGHVRMALQLSLLITKNVTLEHNGKIDLTFPDELPPDVRTLWNIKP